jgi:hypothetical protein
MQVSLGSRDHAQHLPGDPLVLVSKTTSPVEHHRATGQGATAWAPRAVTTPRVHPVLLWAISLAGPYPWLGRADRPKPWTTVQPSTVRPSFSIFIFVYYSRNLNKLQKSIENIINLKKYEVNFYKILKSRYTHRT